MSELKGLYIDPELHKKMKIIAAQKEISLRELAEEIINKELEENGKNTNKSNANGESRRS